MQARTSSKANAGAGRPGPRPRGVRLLILAVLLVALVLAGGCGGGDEGATADENTPTTSDAATTSETEGEESHEASGDTMAAAKEGHQLYIQAGCGGCHGENAEGTEIGPALPGHGEAVVIRQVRSPLDKMPSYSAARLSDEDLHEVAEYIASLAPEETHMEPVELSDLSATHHWMALSAIEAGDLEDALHHLNHIIDLVKGKHLATMKAAREHLEAGDVHEAEHLVEEMLAGTAKPDLSLKRLHLQLALVAIEARDAEEAIHQTRHFVTLAKGTGKQDGRKVVTALAAGDLHEAEHLAQRLLGKTPHDE